jgi:putative tryptophan/tyrosine transport system substrate-binding protein
LLTDRRRREIKGKTMLHRRSFLGIAGSLVMIRSTKAHAQNPKQRIVGFLNSASETGYTAMAQAFSQGLASAGYVDGQQIRIEYRWANNDYGRLPTLVAELLSLGVSVIAANSPSVQPAKAATSAVPIVFLTGGDPVDLGLVASLSRPGGNLTGFNIFSVDLGAKRLALLKEMVPTAKTVGVLINSNLQGVDRFRSAVEVAATKLGVALKIMAVNSAADIDAAFDTFARDHIDALLIGSGPLMDSLSNQLAERTAKIALPAGFESRSAVVAGGLMSYGPSVSEGYRQMGHYTGRILSGERPADLPVMQSTTFDFAINRRTATAMGITVPTSLLAYAEVVLE